MKKIPTLFLLAVLGIAGCTRTTFGSSSVTTEPIPSFNSSISSEPGVTYALVTFNADNGTPNTTVNVVVGNYITPPHRTY
jgi:hypothetical protein